MTSSSGGSSSFSPLGSFRGGPASIPLFQSMPALLYFGISTTCGGLGVECLQPSLNVSGRLCVSPPALVPVVLSTFLVEHVQGQLRCLILVAPCWMKTPWLPTVLNMLIDIPPVVSHHKNLVMEVFIGQALKGLPYLLLILWQLSDVCYADRGSLPQSVRWW